MTNTYQLPVIDVEFVPASRIIMEQQAEEAKMDRDVQEYQDTLINIPF
jgi:hypothetical protein